MLEVLGPAGDPTSDHRAVVWKHRITREFPRRARLEAQAYATSLDDADFARRLDLRHLPFITVDPATARDYDDAVFAERRGAGPLGVVDEKGSVPKVRAGAGASWTKRLWVAIRGCGAFRAPRQRT